NGPVAQADAAFRTGDAEDVVVGLRHGPHSAADRYRYGTGPQPGRHGALGPARLGIGDCRVFQPQRAEQTAGEKEEMRPDLAHIAALRPGIEPAGRIDLPGPRPLREADLDLDPLQSEEHTSEL